MQVTGRGEDDTVREWLNLSSDGYAQSIQQFRMVPTENLNLGNADTKTLDQLFAIFWLRSFIYNLGL
jgi:hypothetical protein